MAGLKTRFRNFFEFIKNPPILYRYLGGAIVAVLLVLTGFFLFPDRDNYLMNLYTEVSGVIVTIVFVNTFLHSQSERRRKKDLKDRLLREVCSPEPDVARKAFHEMRRRRMIFDEASILKGKSLAVARPGTVDLSRANLRGADLTARDLRGFLFVEANLENAKLRLAKLNSANLRNANMVNADLEGAELTDADLRGANLTGANLQHASLDNAILTAQQIHLEEGVAFTELGAVEPVLTLPDRKRIKSDSDLSRFTDPKFWRSDDPESPAHRGHYERRQEIIRRHQEANYPPQAPPHDGGGSG